MEEYDKFRKKLVKVLRVIYLFRSEKDNDFYHSKLIALKKEMEAEKNEATKFINSLISIDLITADMASSLVNDKDNLNEKPNHGRGTALWPERFFVREWGKECGCILKSIKPGICAVLCYIN